MQGEERPRIQPELEHGLALLDQDPGRVSARRLILKMRCYSRKEYSGLIPYYSNVEAWKKEMWGGRSPTREEADQLGQCFEWEWRQAVESMLKHWEGAPPTWY